MQFSDLQKLLIELPLVHLVTQLFVTVRIQILCLKSMRLLSCIMLHATVSNDMGLISFSHTEMNTIGVVLSAAPEVS